MELVDDDGDTVLRLRPPGAGGDSGRAVDVVVCDRGNGPYLAYAKTPHRLLADVDDLDRAVSAIELVHGGKSAPAPSLPEGLVRAAADLAGRTGGAVP